MSYTDSPGKYYNVNVAIPERVQYYLSQPNRFAADTVPGKLYCDNASEFIDNIS